MPLWEKVSLLTDPHVKEYSINKFIRLLHNNEDIFDSNFIIDIIYNFVINETRPPFQHALELLPFLAQRENHIKNSISKLNQIAFLFRSFLKGSDASHRFARLIQEGYQHLILTIMTSLSLPQQQIKTCSRKSEITCKQLVPTIEIMTKNNIVY